MAASPPLTPASATQQLPSYIDSHAPAAVSQQPTPRGACVSSALARFEYEAGHTSVATGTKVLLIEWEAGSQVRGHRGEWTVEWKGGRKQTLLADEGGRTPADADADYGEIRDQPEDGVPTLHSRSEPLPSSDKPTHRLYFILPAGTPVPPCVTISFMYASKESDGNADAVVFAAIPTLPAIFPPSLLTTGTAHGKKGVLHTLWAKSRLHALRAEMAHEAAGISADGQLEAAQSEFEWICENFGIGERYGTDAAQASATGGKTEDQTDHLNTSTSLSSTSSPYPTTPVSPGGSERFLSKMRGLRVGTSESTWSPGMLATGQLQQPTPPQTDSSNLMGKNPLSPEVGDVAVGSFAAIKGASAAAAAAVAAVAAPSEGAPRAKTVVPIAPPSDVTAKQESGFGEMSSLSGMNSLTKTAPVRTFARSETEEGDEQDDELFALPISPRSPETAKSPFSWDPRAVNKAVAAAASTTTAAR